MKLITRTIKSSVITVYGMNPTKPEAGLLQKKVTVFGNYSEMSERDRMRVKNDCATMDFAPACIVDNGEFTEKKYGISLDDFMRYAHEIKADEAVEEA